MAQDFDDFPVYDAVLSPDGQHLSPRWTDYYGTFFTTIIGYLSSFGIFIPNITTAQRNTIQSPQPGQMIYNSDGGGAGIPQLQVWVVTSGTGTWKVFTVV